MILENLIYTFTLFYIIEFLIFFIGLVKSNRTKKVKNYEPYVSIIIAARNEENNILNCLLSLSRLDYPEEKLEVIIVNDQSTDDTENIIKNFIKDKSNFKILNSTISNTHLKGKANALMQGIEVSGGEILLFTDADCVVPRKWVKETVSYFKSDVGIVGGFTILKAKNSFEGMQTLDWLYLYNIAASSATLGFPLTGIGNNLAIKRKNYEQVGGYKNIKFSVTEDYALTRSIIEKTKIKMAYPLNTETLIESLPCSTPTELYHQKIRWGTGGLDMIPLGFLVFSIPFVLNILLIIGFIFLKASLMLIPLTLKIIIDFGMLFYSLNKFRSLRYLKYFFFFEIYLIIYVIILPIVVILNRQVIWKERKL